MVEGTRPGLTLPQGTPSADPRNKVTGYLVAWGAFQCACDGCAVGSPADRPAVADDGDLEPVARCRDPDRRRSLAAYTDQAHLPAALPFTPGLFPELSALGVNR